jgi:hypothetical protein
MKKSRSGDRFTILGKEAAGFSTIIAITWVVEITHLQHYLYGEPMEFNWRRVLLRTLAFACVWAWVHFTTRRVLQRLHHLEEFLRICSWCRKVNHGEEWLTMEEYFGSKFNTETSHGICPECARLHLSGPPTATRVEHSAT